MSLITDKTGCNKTLYTFNERMTGSGSLGEFNIGEISIDIYLFHSKII